MKIFTGIVSILLFMNNLLAQENKDYIQQINQWHAQRIQDLTRPDGWLSLVGLHWLKPGKNTFGADSSNDIVFPPKVPPQIGYFTLEDSIIRVFINSGVSVYHEGKPVRQLQLHHDLSGKPTMLSYGSLLWYVIKRGDRYAIRIKDTLATTRLHFKGIARYPVDPAWRVEAHFQPFSKRRFIEIPTVLGTISREPSPGRLIFTINGQPFSLDVIQEKPGEPYFIVFGDATNGQETYGAGRFLYVEPADASGKTVIDFNKAYNPPCAFTPFATCPLPPPQNVLPIAIPAGEKAYEGGHH